MYRLCFLMYRPAVPPRTAASYDYVFEDQIEFIVDQYLAGSAPVSLILWSFVYFPSKQGSREEGCVASVPGSWVGGCLPHRAAVCPIAVRSGPWPSAFSLVCPLCSGPVGLNPRQAVPLLTPRYRYRLLTTPATRHPSTPQDMEESKEDRMKREREEREAEQRSEFEQIQAARKLLPMFPYRWVGGGWVLVGSVDGQWSCCPCSSAAVWVGGWMPVVHGQGLERSAEHLLPRGRRPLPPAAAASGTSSLWLTLPPVLSSLLPTSSPSPQGGPAEGCGGAPGDCRTLCSSSQHTHPRRRRRAAWSPRQRPRSRLGPSASQPASLPAHTHACTHPRPARLPACLSACTAR